MVKKTIGGISYANRPIMTGESYPRAYVKTRQEAIKLLNFLHTVGYGGNINDLYSEDVEGVSYDERDEQQKAKRFEDTFPKTKGPGGLHPKKDNFFTRIIKKFGDNDDSHAALGGKMD